jgi:hypothetical protein
VSDRFFGAIEVGGDVTRDQQDGMVEVERAVRRAVVSPGGTLQVTDELAEYGRFSALEAYLIEQGIPFDGHSGSYGEFDAEEYSFRPGMSEPLEASADADGVVMADATEVLSYIRLGLTEDRIPSPADGGDVGLALVRLREASPLPPFRIVE